MPLPETYDCVAVRDLDDEALTGVYERLLAPVFRRDELLPPAAFRSAYGPGGGSPSAVVRDGATPVGLALGEWYLDRRVLLLSYLSVAEQARGTGLGGWLVTSVLRGWAEDAGASLVLAEVDDPAVWPGDAHGGDAEARLRFYERHGATLAPLPYVQPSLGPSSERVRGMLLLRLQGYPDRPAVALADAVRAHYVASEGPQAPADEEGGALLRAAARFDDTGGRWWPVSRWPEVRGGSPAG